MLYTFTKEPLYIDDIVVYLKNENTDNNTTRKYKFIGQVIGFTAATVKIRQLSDADKFVTPEECKDYGVVSVYPRDVVHIIISKYQEDMHAKTLMRLNDINYNQKKDIKLLISRWFSALEDEGVYPWALEECIEMANKYYYTEEDYKKYLSTVV